MVPPATYPLPTPNPLLNRVGITWKMFKIDRRRNQPEVVDVPSRSIGLASAGSQNGAFTELNGAAWASRGARRATSTRTASVRAKIALVRLVATVVKTDCAIWTRHHAFLTPGTPIRIDLYDTAIPTFRDRVGPTGPETRRPTALLANADDELEPFVLMRRRDPIDTIAKDPLHKTIFELAGSLASSTARATLQINRQR